MTNTEEATAIFIRLFESLARRSGATLKPSTRADIARACELLSTGRDDYDLLDDLLTTPPRATPGERAARDFAAVPAEVERWRAERAARESEAA
jgi:hypothetical protein